MRALELSALALLIASSSTQMARGQGAPLTPPEARLDTTVRLTLGQTTAAKVAKALSEQTGLVIEMDECLKDRDVVVQFAGLTARQVMDTLAELNDWRWRRTESGHYEIGRPKIVPANNPTDVAALMKEALPLDFRRYLGIGVSDKEWRWYLPEAQRQRYERTGDDAFGAYNNEMRDRPLKAIWATITPLYESLLRDLPPGKPRSYDALTQEQKDALLLSLLLRAVNQSEYALLHDDVPLPPYLHDLSNALLEGADGNLAIMCYAVNGARRTACGFGGVPLPK